MHNQAQQAGAALSTKDTVIVKSRNGNQFQVSGLHLIPAKLVALLAFIVDMLNHDIVNFIFTIEPTVAGKKRKLGLFSELARTIIIDVQAIVDLAMGMIQKKDNRLAYRAIVWRETLVTILHELIHSEIAFEHFTKTGNRLESLTGQAYKEWELNIDRRACDMLRELAKHVDVELPDLAEWPWFAGRAVDIDRNIAKDDAAWKTKQAVMLHNGYVYFDSTEPMVEHKSMDDYLRYCSTEEEADKWPKEKEKIVINNPSAFEVQTEADVKAKAEAEAAAKVKAAQDAFVVEVHKTINDVFKRAADHPVSEQEVAMWCAMNHSGATLDVLLDNVRARVEANATGEATYTPGPNGTVAMTLPADSVTFEQVDDPAAAGFDPEYLHEPENYSTGYDEQGGVHGGGDTSNYSVEAVQQTMAQAEAVGQAQAQLQQQLPTAQATLPTFAIDQVTLRTLMLGVYTRLYNHLFTKCGWSIGPQGVYHFANDGGVVEPVNIGNDPRLSHIIAGMTITKPDRTRTTSQLMKGPDGFYMAGTFTSGYKGAPVMPCYELIMNGGDGIPRKRRLIPQNPLKIDNNAYTKPGLAAQQGSRIAYVFDADIPVGQKGGLKAKCQNGVWE